MAEPIIRVIGRRSVVMRRERVESITFRVPVHKAPIAVSVEIPAIRARNRVFSAWLSTLEAYASRNPGVTVREWVELVNPYVSTDPCIRATEHVLGTDHRWQECPTYHEEGR